MTLRTLNYGNYGIFLIMGHAGFCPSTVRILVFAVLFRELNLPEATRVVLQEGFPRVFEGPMLGFRGFVTVLSIWGLQLPKYF